MKSTLLAAALMIGVSAKAAEPAAKLPLSPVEACEAAHCIEISDLSSRFLAFYEAAREKSDADERFALWKTHYGFAAVPPGPQGEAMSRRLLDAAWPRYAGSLEVIEKGAKGIDPSPLETLGKVAALLALEEPINVRLIAYVGGFEDNAFSMSDNGRPVVAIPIETSNSVRQVLLAHEMTHAVHYRTAGLGGGWERSIAQTVLQEGLAMHVSRAAVPGRGVTDYVENHPGWFAEAEAKRSAILAGILPVLDKMDGETVFEFTIGKGPQGLERQAYAVGWWVVEDLLSQGMTLPQIARIPEDEMAATVRSSILRMTS